MTKVKPKTAEQIIATVKAASYVGDTLFGPKRSCAWFSHAPDKLTTAAVKARALE